MAKIKQELMVHPPVLAINLNRKEGRKTFMSKYMDIYSSKYVWKVFQNEDDDQINRCQARVDKLTKRQKTSYKVRSVICLREDGSYYLYARRTLEGSLDYKWVEYSNGSY